MLGLEDSRQFSREGESLFSSLSLSLSGLYKSPFSLDYTTPGHFVVLVYVKKKKPMKDKHNWSEYIYPWNNFIVVSIFFCFFVERAFSLSSSTIFTQHSLLFSVKCYAHVVFLFLFSSHLQLNQLHGTSLWHTLMSARTTLDEHHSLEFIFAEYSIFGNVFVQCGCTLITN